MNPALFNNIVLPQPSAPPPSASRFRPIAPQVFRLCITDTDRLGCANSYDGHTIPRGRYCDISLTRGCCILYCGEKVRGELVRGFLFSLIIRGINEGELTIGGPFGVPLEEDL